MKNPVKIGPILNVKQPKMTPITQPNTKTHLQLRKSPATIAEISTKAAKIIGNVSLVLNISIFSYIQNRMQTFLFFQSNELCRNIIIRAISIIRNWMAYVLHIIHILMHIKHTEVMGHVHLLSKSLEIWIKGKSLNRLIQFIEIKLGLFFFSFWSKFYASKYSRTEKSLFANMMKGCFFHERLICFFFLIEKSN